MRSLAQYLVAMLLCYQAIYSPTVASSSVVPVQYAATELALLLPVAAGTTVAVTDGYNSPPPWRPSDCDILKKVPDHCANQAFGLDLRVGTTGFKILAPAPGWVDAIVAGSGGPGMLYQLKDGTNLNIFHFAGTWVQADPSHQHEIQRGDVLGTSAQPWVHLSLDDRHHSAARPPKEFIAPYTLEGLSLPNGNIENQYARPGVDQLSLTSRNGNPASPPLPIALTPRVKTFSSLLGWWVVVNACGSGNVPVKLDNNTIFSTEPNVQTRWVGPGTHVLEWTGMAVDVDYAWWPVSPACADNSPAPAPLPPATDPQPIAGSSPPVQVPKVNGAQFTGQENYLDGTVVAPGQSFNKLWTLKNTGTSTWGSGYTLAPIGDPMGSSGPVSVPNTPPGGTANIGPTLTAPAGDGSYRSYWQLNDAQGTPFGDKVWVQITVKGANTSPGSTGGTGTGSTQSAVFDVSPASPSSATSVHLVGRVADFTEFRSMRFVIGNQQMEMPNPRQVGGQREISYDWDTSTLPRGDYTLLLEVASKTDTNWTNPQRFSRTYTLTGTPAPAVHPPDRPVLQSPYDWYLKDASGSAGSVQLCVNPSSSPDGGTVQYYFQLQDQIGNPTANSGWITSICWTSTVSPGIYSWKAKAGVNNGQAASDWSLDTWNFSVASGGVSIGGISLYNQNTNDTHMCVPITYGGIQAPDVYAWLNKAADGSENGEWRLLDHYGPNTTPDCTQSNVHGWWIRSPEYETGTHAIRISAIKRDSGASATSAGSYPIAYIKPPDPQPLVPSTSEHNGTFWNALAIPFQWTSVLRAEQYQLRASTSADLWNDPSPLVNVSLPSATTSYTATFTQDYGRLYWSVKATNSAGYGVFGGPWFGIDRVAPNCSVQALPATTYETSFQVTWAGSDNSAGIRSYDIQSRDSRTGIWSDWLTGVPVATTYKFFNGLTGHAYAFRCRATDNAGNLGSYPASADTSTTVNPASRPPTPWWVQAYSGKYNIPILNNMPSTSLPAGYPVRLHFDSTTAPTASELYNASQVSIKCDDLRIVYNDATEIDRLIEDCSSSAINVRFKTQVSISGGTSNNTSHQLYYGNPSAVNPLADTRNVWPPSNDGNTVGLWYLSEGSGSTSADYSGRGNNITSIGAMSWCDGDKFNKALCTGSVDVGPDGAFIPGNSSLSSNAFTFEAFVKRGSQSYGTIAAQGESNNANERWSFYLQEGKLAFGLWHSNGGGSVMTDSAVLPDSNWHHLAFTFDGCNAVKLYVDGTVVKSGSMPNCGIINNNFDLYVGSGFKPYGGRNFLGTMDQVRFSNVVRTSFPYAAFATITSEPSVAVGAAIARPVAGSPDLAVLSVNTYPNPDGGTLVQAVVQNQGNLGTKDGFYIDLYKDHAPSGANDLSGSVRYWEASPLAAGATITVTTVITNPVSSSEVAVQGIESASDVISTIYVQADSTGMIPGTNRTKAISAASSTCLSAADAFESDSTATVAKAIATDGTAQTHNLQAPGDQDWASFSAVKDTTYIMSTSNLGPSVDTVLSVYGTDGQTVLATNDDYVGLASQIVWQAPARGTYFVKATNWDVTAGGCGTNYDLSVLALVNEEPLPSPSPSPSPSPISSPTGTPSLTLTASPGSVSPGQTVNVSWSAFSASGNDWISLHPSGAPDSNYLYWQYAQGSSGTLTFTAPSNSSSYDFRLFRNGTKVATSNSFQVDSSSPSPSPTGSPVPTSSPTATPIPAVATIQPAPGISTTVSIPGSQGDVIVPNDAGGNTPLKVVVQPVAAPTVVPSDMTVLSAIQISFSNLTNNSAVHNLTEDVTIEISYAGLGLTQDQINHLTIYNASEGEWLTTTIDSGRQVAIARTRRFSTFTLALITGPVPRYYLPVLMRLHSTGW